MEVIKHPAAKGKQQEVEVQERLSILGLTLVLKRNGRSERKEAKDFSHGRVRVVLCVKDGVLGPSSGFLITKPGRPRQKEELWFPIEELPNLERCMDKVKKANKKAMRRLNRRGLIRSLFRLFW